MDSFDPLDSNDIEIQESKVILTEEIVNPKIQLDSDEENVVSHLSPESLLEGQENDYAIRSPDGMITYRVLQVDDGMEQNTAQIVASGGTSYSIAGTQPVLTGNINGQLYVIGSNDVFGQTGTRAIAPRGNFLPVEVGSSSTTAPMTFKKRDDRRRATHNEVERRRRDKINNWINKLGKIIPESDAIDAKGNGHYDGQSKGGILAKACDYIVELKESDKKCKKQLADIKTYLHSIEQLKEKNIALERENRTLKELIKRSGIADESLIM